MPKKVPGNDEKTRKNGRALTVVFLNDYAGYEKIAEIPVLTVMTSRLGRLIID